MQKTKLIYAKRTLTDRTIVTSESLTEQLQSYKIIYLEKTKQYMDKVRIYSFDRPECNPRSLSFLNPEELLTFIKDCIHSYLFLKEQRVKPELVIPLSEYRVNIMLPDLLKSIKEYQINKWRNGDNGKNLELS